MVHTLERAQSAMDAPQPVSLVSCDSAAPTLEFHPVCAEMEKLCYFECRTRSLRTSKCIWTVILIALWVANGKNS